MFLFNQGEPISSKWKKKITTTFGHSAVDRISEYMYFLNQKGSTPLLKMSKLSLELGVGSIYIKDEGKRFGLGSFKTLGGSYALVEEAKTIIYEKLKRKIEYWDFMDQAVTSEARSLIFCCATDGNHGCSVAFGAALIGAKAKIFVHENVTQYRISRVEKLGAEVIVINGTYDDAVNESKDLSEKYGWKLISDTSWPGYEKIPTHIMQGYLPIISESIKSIDSPPSHVFLQAGVGGMAAAVAAHLFAHFGEYRPKIIVVEPERADCIFQSMKMGKPMLIEETESTNMSMLECYEPSLIAWDILSQLADVFITVSEEQASLAVDRLQSTTHLNDIIDTTESGAAGLAGLISAMENAELRKRLILSENSSVLLFNTEAANNPLDSHEFSPESLTNKMNTNV